jgi:hypothetical protein
MKFARGCLLWFALYLVVAGALVVAVERRIGQRQPAVFAGAIGGFIAWLALSYLANSGRKLNELRLIWRSVHGVEPADGARFAAVGPITPSGGQRLVSPITHTPAVAYSYEIIVPAGEGVDKWQGVALIPSTIRCGVQSIRLLALPELDFRKDRPKSEAAMRNAAEYIRATEFQSAAVDGRNIKQSFKDLWSIYTDDDGAVRQDLGRPGQPPPLDRALFVEQVVRPNEPVCAFGRYSAARAALVVDPRAPLHSVRMIRGEPGALVASRVRSLIGNAVTATVMLALVVAALAGLYAVVPLDVERPSSLEIRVEKVLDEYVRPALRDLGVASTAGRE